MTNNVIEPPTEDDDWMFGQEIHQIEKILQKEIIAQVMLVLEGMSVSIELDAAEAMISIIPWPNCGTFVDIPLKKVAEECASSAVSTGEAKSEEWKERMREALAPILEILGPI